MKESELSRLGAGEHADHARETRSGGLDGTWLVEVARFRDDGVTYQPVARFVIEHGHVRHVLNCAGLVEDIFAEGPLTPLVEERLFRSTVAGAYLKDPPHRAVGGAALPEHEGGLTCDRCHERRRRRRRRDTKAPGAHEHDVHHGEADRGARRNHPLARDDVSRSRLRGARPTENGQHRRDAAMHDDHAEDRLGVGSGEGKAASTEHLVVEDAEVSTDSEQMQLLGHGSGEVPAHVGDDILRCQQAGRLPRQFEAPVRAAAFSTDSWSAPMTEYLWPPGATTTKSTTSMSMSLPRCRRLTALSTSSSMGVAVPQG